MTVSAEECKRAVEVEIPAAEVEQEFTRVARDFQKRARIPGFRPGKAPLSLVRQRFEQSIREEVLQHVIPAYLRSTVERENLQPVSTPSIEDLHFHQGEPIRFKASFDVLPQIHLGEYKSLHVHVPEESATDAEVEAAIEDLRERQSTYDAVAEDESEGKLTAEQTAVVSYDRTVEGSEPEHVEESYVDLAADDVIPEFKQALVGSTIGETREWDVNYPADYPNQRLRAKTVHFAATVKERKRKVRPNLDDDLARSTGEFESLEQMRTQIRENITRRKQLKAEQEAREEIISKLIEMHPFPVPQSLIDQQTETRVRRGARSLQAQGVDLRKLKLDWNRIAGEQREPAEREVRTALILDRIAEAEGIHAPEAEVEAEVARLARDSGQPEGAVRRKLSEDGTLDRLREQLRNEHTLDALYRSATGKEPYRVRVAQLPPEQAVAEQEQESQSA